MAHAKLQSVVKRLVTVLALACSEQAAVPRPPGHEAGVPPQPATQAKTALEVDATARRQRLSSCRSRIAEAVKEQGQIGAPLLEERRAQILGRAKATPVLFTQQPHVEGTERPAAQRLRQRLSENPTPRELGDLYRNFYLRPELARSVLLRDGYLYTEEPGLAFALVQKVELSHLFSDEVIRIQRGSQVFEARRSEGEYVYATGPEVGQPAKVLLFDRVWNDSEAPTRSLHVDLETVADALGFWRSRLEYASDHWVVLNLLYGEQWVLSLFRRNGAALNLECELLEPRYEREVMHARAREKRQRALLVRQHRAIEAMIEEALPFDEPRTEEGQEDGKLRPEWRGAYRLRRDWYEFNGDKYYVFDRHGRPRVPQVCIDFITDTLERASGTWWRSRDQERARVLGSLSFDAFDIDNRRSVERFTKFAWEHPERFDVYYSTPDERIPLSEGDEFFAHLAEHAARYRPGDIINILGLRSDEKYHYHSFFVFKADPVSGMPIWLAGNAGRPRLRSWYGEMLNAPRRSIQSRIRPRLEWLETVIDSGQPIAEESTSTDVTSG